MKKLMLSLTMLSALSLGALQLTATAQDCNSCEDQCSDDYYNCVISGEDERACVADVIECYDDCNYYCN